MPTSQPPGSLSQKNTRSHRRRSGASSLVVTGTIAENALLSAIQPTRQQALAVTSKLMADPVRPGDDRPIASPPLDVVQAFVNKRLITADDPYAREDLSSPAALDVWWRSHHPGASVTWTVRDRELAIAIREGLRAVLARHNTASIDGDAAAIERLKAIAATLPLQVSYASMGDPVVPAGSNATANALAGLLARTVQGRIDGRWTRLKARRDPLCRAAFYDTSRNQSGTWCSMRLCGARAKQRAYVNRRRQQQQQRS